MHIFNRAPKPSLVSMRDATGEPCSLRIKFKNGVIHIDSDRMQKGRYQIQVSQGRTVDEQRFTIG